MDFGSQYSQLIARRVRENNVYCEIIAHDSSIDVIKKLEIKGIILSGGPASVYSNNAPIAPLWVYEIGVPILGICYGMQVMVHQLGGNVNPSSKKEFGHSELNISNYKHDLFNGLDLKIQAWMSHGDRITKLPEGFEKLAFTDNSPIAAIGDSINRIGLQFHPEVSHTPLGNKIISNFLYNICHCKGNWTPENFVLNSVDLIKKQIGNGNVICALSGGVDSLVTASLIHKAIGDQLTCIFVNNGLMRKEEPERILETFNKNMNINLIYKDASELFLEKLKSVIDPEEKRKVIGKEFIRVFELESSNLGEVDFLAQGTLYPDVIESKTGESEISAKIKTHHNVGGLPDNMKLDLVEPLRYLFKDEVRKVGLELGLPEEMVFRQPFPGPGLAIRTLGEVTKEKLDILRASDWIVMDEIKSNGLYRDLWQSFAVLTDTHTVGVSGDFRTYGYLIAIRAVTSKDAMTADWARLPYDVLSKISNRIANEVKDVNRIVYDITSKPPGTIEWE
ncbi:MAG: glutamine-hydrolyzing GMP synthase [Chloroflexi bacterium]|nr:glutamine-hydrolyzing GMP synthase [Chloroflexota bacterium]|tara:strand:- start:11589 stop:13106 length:1518 start_codon:yes stop_codon:yes gene_type:complete